MPKNTVPITVNIRVETDENLREFTKEHHGKIRGEMGRVVDRAIREYLDMDRYARIEDNQKEIKEMVREALSENGLERERNSSEDSKTSSDSNSIVDRRVLNAADELPNAAEVSTAMVKAAIREGAGVTAYKSLNKYLDLLRERNHIFQSPIKGEDKYYTSEGPFVMKLERDDRIKPHHIEDIVKENKPELGDDWYLEGLRDINESFLIHGDLKYDAIDDFDSEPFLVENGLVDDQERGFQ